MRRERDSLARGGHAVRRHRYLDGRGGRQCLDALVPGHQHAALGFGQGDDGAAGMKQRLSDLKLQSGTDVAAHAIGLLMQAKPWSAT
jgi:hypothetical protein